MHYKFLWFTKSCISHYISHIAVFFIIVGTKTFIAESFLNVYYEIYLCYLYIQSIIFIEGIPVCFISLVLFLSIPLIV